MLPILKDTRVSFIFFNSSYNGPWQYLPPPCETRRPKTLAEGEVAAGKSDILVHCTKEY